MLIQLQVLSCKRMIWSTGFSLNGLGYKDPDAPMIWKSDYLIPLNLIQFHTWEFDNSILIMYFVYHIIFLLWFPSHKKKLFVHVWFQNWHLSARIRESCSCQHCSPTPKSGYIHFSPFSICVSLSGLTDCKFHHSNTILIKLQFAINLLAS